MAGKTISFVLGKGSLAHNNREFIADNVDPERTDLNESYVKESLENAYKECFGQALEDYNAKQKRKDRIKDDYISEIKHSGNGEKVFYENVVQIGDMYDTGIVGPDGKITADAKQAAGILDEYARSFQERNPNLHVFNMVLHMDEATPHLHIDYIPVAHGYKTGLETRNSLSKAYQQMGIPKARNKLENETTMWHLREREYITELAREHGLEIVVKGVDRPGLSLPEYRETMAEVDELRAQAAELQIENAGLIAEKEELKMDVAAAEQVREEILKEAEETEEKLQRAQDILDGDVFKHNSLQENYLKLAEEAVATDQDKPVAQKIKTPLGKDTGYVKVAESDWKKILRILRVTKTKDRAVENMAKDMAEKDSKIKKLTDTLDKCYDFLKHNKLFEAFTDLIKPKVKKRESFRDRLERKKEEIAKHEAARVDVGKKRAKDISI